MLKKELANITNWDLGEEVLAQSISFNTPTAGEELKIEQDELAKAQMEALADICQVICVVLMPSPDTTSQKLKLLIDLAKNAKAINTAVILPPYISTVEQYDNAELTNTEAQRGIVAKSACENRLSIIDPSMPHMIRTAKKNPKIWLSRIWKKIALDFIPPKNFPTNQPVATGTMQGLASLQKKFT